MASLVKNALAKRMSLYFKVSRYVSVLMRTRLQAGGRGLKSGLFTLSSLPLLLALVLPCSFSLSSSLLELCVALCLSPC